MTNAVLKGVRSEATEIVEVGVGLDHLQKLSSVKEPIIALDEGLAHLKQRYSDLMHQRVRARKLRRS